MRNLRGTLAGALLISVLVCTTSAQAQLTNGDFSDTTGAPWVFVDQSMNGSVSYAGMNAVVTGGDDMSGTTTNTWIEQPFSLGAGNGGTLTFVWSYASVDDPGFDSCIYDIEDAATGNTIIGGPIILSDTDGQSGAVSMPFTGSGSYVLKLGTNSDDNDLGPGVSTFDDVVVSGGGAGNFIRGDVNDDAGLSLPDVVVLLNFLFPGPTPFSLVCDDAGDANDDGSINLQDPIAILNALFGQPTVPLPGPSSCGPDVGADMLDCANYTSC